MDIIITTRIQNDTRIIKKHDGNNYNKQNEKHNGNDNNNTNGNNYYDYMDNHNQNNNQNDNKLGSTTNMQL